MPATFPPVSLENFFLNSESERYDGRNETIQNVGYINGRGRDIHSTLIDQEDGPVLSIKEITDCVFNGSFIMSNWTIQDELVFKNCEFHIDYSGDVIFNKLKGNRIKFENCKFIGGTLRIQHANSIRITFWGCDISSLSVTNCTIPSIDFQPRNNLNQIGGLAFYECDKIDYVIMNELNCEGNLTFQNGCPANIRLNGGYFLRISFPITKNINVLKLQRAANTKKVIRIDTIDLFDIDLSGQIAIEGCSVGSLRTLKFYNNGDFRIQNTEIKKNLSFLESDLGGMKMNDIKISEHSTILLDYSYLTNVVFANVKWPKENKITSQVEYPFEKPKRNIKWLEKSEKENHHRVLRESYRQLKAASKAGSDNINALIFYRNEMHSYMHYIDLSKTENFWTRLLIKINFAASNFGLSYLRPIVLLFIFNLFFFLLIKIDTCNSYMTDNYLEEYKCYSHGFNLSSFINLLNPAHELDSSLSNFSTVIDFMSRIFTGFFIYHIIKSTRRYSKL